MRVTNLSCRHILSTLSKRLPLCSFEGRDWMWILLWDSTPRSTTRLWIWNEWSSTRESTGKTHARMLDDFAHAHWRLYLLWCFLLILWHYWGVWCSSQRSLKSRIQRASSQGSNGWKSFTVYWRESRLGGKKLQSFGVSPLFNGLSICMGEANTTCLYSATTETSCYC